MSVMAVLMPSPFSLTLWTMVPNEPFSVVKSNTPYHSPDCNSPEKKTTAKASAR